MHLGLYVKLLETLTIMSDILHTMIAQGDSAESGTESTHASAHGETRPQRFCRKEINERGQTATRCARWPFLKCQLLGLGDRHPATAVEYFDRCQPVD